MKEIKERVISAIVAASIIALLAGAWQLVTDGGLVRSLGGVTESDLQAIRPPPSGAVLAFDLTTGCPEGWSKFVDGQSRVIVGAAFDSNSPGTDEDKQPLSVYRFRETGGKEQHALQIKEMPKHQHRVSGGWSVEDPEDQGVGGGELTNGHLASGDHFSAEVGDGSPHPNMPPFLPLYFCKKDAP